jgi:hypothetical protein
MKKFLLLIVFSIPVLVLAQWWKPENLSVSIFNNATLLPPASLTAAFNQPIHPGFLVSSEFGWKDHPKYKWFQNAGIGYFYHRYVYHAFLLTTKAGYRRYLGKFSLEGSLNAGYMHAFLLTDRLVLQDDGTYKAKKGFGKPQFVAGLGIGAGYNFGTAEKLKRLFVAYDLRLQMPFVKSYVTLLPNGSLSLGMQFTIR